MLRDLTVCSRRHEETESRWERGEVLPSLETLQDVIGATGLELRFRLEEGNE